MKGLSLYEFSDRELLALVADLSGGYENGYVTAQEVQDSINLSSKHPTSSIGVRFAWMKRYGIMEQDPDGTKGWRLTAKGEQVRRMHLPKAVERALEGLDPTAGMEAMLALGSIYASTAKRPEGVLMRRAWKYASGTR